MSLIIPVKFNSVTNLSDARYASGVGASYVGFNINPENPFFIDAEKMKEIAAWIQGPELVLEWDDLPADYILEETKNIGLQWAQLNAMSMELLQKLEDYSVIQSVVMNEQNDLKNLLGSLDNLVSFFELSFSSEVRQEEFFDIEENQNLLKEICRDYPVYFSFFWNEKNILPMIDHYQPRGISLQPGNEIKPGYKDFDALISLMDLLEV